MSAKEWRVWDESGHLYGYLRLEGSNVEDYSDGHYQGTYIGEGPEDAERWASGQADELLAATIAHLPEEARGHGVMSEHGISLQFVEDAE